MLDSVAADELGTADVARGTKHPESSLNTFPTAQTGTERRQIAQQE